MKSLATIWSIIEAVHPMPPTLLVTSATFDDDTAGVAQGLVKASNGAGGHHTGYLALCGGKLDTQAPLPSLALPDGSSCTGFDEAMQTWHVKYDVIIVEIPALLGNELGAHAARTAGGVIVAVQENRTIQRADHELSKLLKRLGAPLLGAVATAPPVAGAFGSTVMHSQRAPRSLFAAS